jgi:hypothetical protein
LTWDDIERNGDEEKPSHCWDPLSPIPRDRIEKLADGEHAANDLDEITGVSSFDHLLGFLRDPNSAAWTNRARDISTVMFLKGMLARLAGIDGAARELADGAVHGYRDSITHRGPIIVGTGTAGGNSVHLDRTAANDRNSLCVFYSHHVKPSNWSLGWH